MQWFRRKIKESMGMLINARNARETSGFYRSGSLFGPLASQPAMACRGDATYMQLTCKLHNLCKPIQWVATYMYLTCNSHVSYM